MTTFDQAEELSDTFLDRIVSGLRYTVAALRRNDTDIAALLAHSNDAFASMPVDGSKRSDPDVQAIALAALRQHQQSLLNRSVDGAAVTEDASIFRRLVESLSVLKDSRKRINADALLSFQLTAAQPSADELDSDDEETAQRLSRTRSDLRVALLVHDIAAVFELTESEMVQIALKREAHELVANAEAQIGSSLLLKDGDVEIEAIFDAKTAFADQQCDYRQFSVRNQYAQAVLAGADDMQTTRRRQTPLVIAAAHHYEQSGAQALSVAPVAFSPLEPLMDWHKLSSNTLAQIGTLVYEDNAALLQRKPARPTAGSEKLIVVLRTVQWLVQLTYLASISGVLAVRIGTIHQYETTQWMQIKALLVQLSEVIEEDVVMPLLAGQEEVLRRLDAKKRRQAMLAALSQLPSGPAVRALLHFNGRCAGLLAIAGVLARGVTFDAAGERRGINPLVFADSLHASFDVAAHIALEMAVPAL